MREIINHIMNRMAKAVDMLEKIHDHDLAPKRIMIQQLNEHLGQIDPAELLPPEEISEHLVIEDLSVNDEQEYEPYFASASSADETSQDYDIIRRDERVIFWLPRNVCLVNLFIYSLLKIILNNLFSLYRRKLPFSQKHEFLT